MEIINLTEEEVKIITASSKEVVIPPSGQKIEKPTLTLENSTTYPNFFRVENEVFDKMLIQKKIARVSFRLPPRRKGTLYIVDMHTLALINYFYSRNDFMFVVDGNICTLQRKKSS